jgi:hypothetical protein
MNEPYGFAILVDLFSAAGASANFSATVEIVESNIMQQAWIS